MGVTADCTYQLLLDENLQNQRQFHAKISSSNQGNEDELLNTKNREKQNAKIRKPKKIYKADY